VKGKERQEKKKKQVGGKLGVFFQGIVVPILTPRLQRDLSFQPHHTHHTLHPSFWACDTDIGLPYAT
jgi:hypothetical protein